MKPDMTISWDQHLKGNVWRVEVELSMQDTPGDFYYCLHCGSLCSGTYTALAMYIVTTMYPDYESISVDDEPTRTAA